jgi:hypothetical protein
MRTGAGSIEKQSVPYIDSIICWHMADDGLLRNTIRTMVIHNHESIVKVDIKESIFTAI